MGRRSMLSFALFGATIGAYATYHSVINGLVAMVGRSVLSAAIAAAARLGVFVGTRAAAGAWLGPWGVAATTVASIVIFFVLTEDSAEASSASPVVRYRKEIQKQWQIYRTSSSPYAQLEALRKMYVVVYGMQLCLDAAIDEQIYAGGKIYSQEPQRKSQMLLKYTEAVTAYKRTVTSTGATLQHILFTADNLMRDLRSAYGWNQAMMKNVYNPYHGYFTHFAQQKMQWDASRGGIKTDSRSVQNYLFRSKLR